MNGEGVHLGLYVVSSGVSLPVSASIAYSNCSLGITDIDSGAAGHFLDCTFARSLGFPFEELESPTVMRGLDDNPLTHGVIHHQTPPLLLSVGGMHSESIVFLLTNCSAVSLVLGHHWPMLHNLH